MSNKYSISDLVRRWKIFEDSYLQISALNKSEMKTARQRLWIDFEGEDSQDYGGVAREVCIFYILIDKHF